MATRQLQTSQEPVICEICRRSLLRGEHPSHFRDGAELHTVCELCTGRALEVGWIRDGSTVADAVQTRTVRARSLVGRLRARLEDPQPAQPASAPSERNQREPSERTVHAV